MRKILIALAILVVAIGGYFLFKQGSPGGGSTANHAGESDSPESGATAQTVAEIPTYQYTETFTHPTYKFSFKYPKDFTVSDVPTDTNETILVQNIAKKVGVQILISPFKGSDIDMTVEVIHTDLPDLKIDAPQEVLIGTNRKGLAFVSDNPAFGGKSREVWFVFKGRLYQISTYQEFDGFLKGLFATWKFQ